MKKHRYYCLSCDIKLFRTTAAIFLALCGAAVPEASAFSVSTASVTTDLDALDFLAQEANRSTSRIAQDYLYTGNDRLVSLRPRPAVWADPGAAPGPVAAYTAQAGAIRSNLRRTVPPLPGTTEMALAVNGIFARSEKTSFLKKAGNWFSDAFAAVKQWVSAPVTWVHDKIMGKGRPLTAEETAAMRRIFGGSVDYSKVRIVTGSKMGLWGKILTSGNKAVTWGKTIYFPNGSGGKSQYEFSSKAYWLAHEMTHGYQYQRYGWGYVPRSLWGQLTEGNSFYSYELEAGKDFRKYNVEQQAVLVEHYYQIQNGTRSATPEELAIYQEVMTDQGFF